MMRPTEPVKFEEGAAGDVPLYVVFTTVPGNTDEDMIDVEVCCYTRNYDIGRTACEEYAAAWVTIHDHKDRKDDLFEEAAEDALNNPECRPPTEPGYHVRYDPDTMFAMRILVYYKKPTRTPDNAPCALVRTFVLQKANMWVDDYVRKVTPAVMTLEADDCSHRYRIPKEKEEIAPPNGE